MKLLEGAIQNYAWGSVDSIPRLLGVEPTGDPQAELWLGAHRLKPSRLPHDDSDLLALVTEHPEVLGEKSREQFGDVLPFMLKILAAGQPLSLQAHPNRAEAEAGFAKENEEGIDLQASNRTYKDDWPKPEMALALTDFVTLSGFRPASQTAALFERLGIPGLDSVIGPLTQRGGSAALAEVFLDALSLSEERRGLVDQVVAACLPYRDEDSEMGRFARTALELDEHYPGDRGILAALLLNRVELKPGEATYLEPGNLHAHMRGTCVEIMANSDNVLRGGLTVKHIDVDGLLQVLTFTGEEKALVTPETPAPGLVHYPTDAPEFALWKIHVGRDTDSSEPTLLPATEGARILFVLDGFLACATADETQELVKGQAAFIPAGEVVRVHGDAEAYLASAGVYA